MRMGVPMVAVSIADRLLSATREDLARYERLLIFCGEEYRCLSGPNLDALSSILDQKERLIREIQENSDRHAPLWTRIQEGEGDESGMDDLEKAVQGVLKTVVEIQASEDKIASLAAKRSKEVKKALGTLSRSGKALAAYKPTITYAPRFIDKKE